MRARDILTLIGAALLALGPELQIEGATPLEWRIGRYARVLGAVLLGTRAATQGRGTQPPKEPPTA
jgi:hypothetical protein